MGIIIFWLQFIPLGQITNKSTLVQWVFWRRRGDKPLAELKVAKITEAHPRLNFDKLNG